MMPVSRREPLTGVRVPATCSALSTGVLEQLDGTTRGFDDRPRPVWGDPEALPEACPAPRSAAPGFGEACCRLVSRLA